MSGINKIVLAYSGGLDTSAIIPWLKEHYDAEIIAFVADVGQERDDLEGIEQKAIASGAVKCIVKDLREEFVKEYVYPTLKTGAVYEGTYLLGTSMARPVIAKAMVEAALAEGADAISHGCTGKGNDQVRFEGAVAALAPQLKVIAPWRLWDMRSREDLLAYLEARNIPCKATLKKIYSRDANAQQEQTDNRDSTNQYISTKANPVNHTNGNNNTQYISSSSVKAKQATNDATRSSQEVVSKRHNTFNEVKHDNYPFYNR
jgi:argininosuccinate synthase